MARLIDSSRCKNTDYATSTWVRALERFRSDCQYPGLVEQVDSKDELEDQLCRFIHAIKRQDGSDYHTSSLNNCLHSINRHLNEKSTLPKPINLLNKEEYYKLWKVYNAKVKNLASNGLGERKGAEGFTEEELLQIINHPTMSVNNPIGLLRRVFFFNAILLGLRGGEHFTLQSKSFLRKKDKYGGFEVILYHSKTNQREANNIQAQGEKLYIPNIPEIIDMYELYFSKRPTQASTHFYLKPCGISECKYCILNVN